ncbi:anti-phage ZorAB system protein ZorA [Desulfovulcanus sp.]
MPILESMFKLIVSVEGVTIFCILIVVTAFLLYYIGLNRRTMPMQRKLKYAVEKLRSMPDLKNFASEFRTFDEWISNVDIFQHLWSEFKETLVIPSSTAADKVICNTKESACYFNENSVIFPSVDLRFYNAVPNYLTGAGILGTFIGLVGGIYLASKGLASDNARELNESLQNLLSGASLAFWTSIVGIITSIIFSWREKSITHKLRTLLYQWNEELDKRIERITPESLAQKQLMQLERQSEYLEEFTTQVAFNIAELLNDRMNEKLVPALDKLVDAVEAMRREREYSNEQLLREMVDKFVETINGAAGKEVAALSDTLNNLNEILTPLLKEMREVHGQMHGAAAYIAEQIKESYEKSGKNFNEGVQTAINELKAGIAQAGEVLNRELKESFERAIQKFEDTVKALDASISNLGQTGHNTKEMVVKTESLLNRFDNIAQSMAMVEKGMDRSIKTVERAAESIEKGGNAISNAVTQFQKTLDEFQNAANEFRSVQETLQEIWQAYAKRFEDLDTSLERVFAQMEDGLKAYAEATSNYMRELDKHAKTVTELFGGAVVEFTEAINELNEVLYKSRQY